MRAARDAHPAHVFVAQDAHSRLAAVVRPQGLVLARARALAHEAAPARAHDGAVRVLVLLHELIDVLHGVGVCNVEQTPRAEHDSARRARQRRTHGAAPRGAALRAAVAREVTAHVGRRRR